MWVLQQAAPMCLCVCAVCMWPLLCWEEEAKQAVASTLLTSLPDSNMGITGEEASATHHCPRHTCTRLSPPHLTPPHPFCAPPPPQHTPAPSHPFPPLHAHPTDPVSRDQPRLQAGHAACRDLQHHPGAEPGPPGAPGRQQRRPLPQLWTGRGPVHHTGQTAGVS